MDDHITVENPFRSTDPGTLWKPFPPIAKAIRRATGLHQLAGKCLIVSPCYWSPFNGFYRPSKNTSRPCGRDASSA